MTAPNQASVAVKASGVDLSVTAVPVDNGNVNCKVTCNNQSVGVTFTGTDVLIDFVETPPSA